MLAPPTTTANHYCPPLPFPLPRLQVTGLQLPYDTVEDLRGRMSDVAPHFSRVGELETANFFALANKLLKVVL